jgi:acyl-CoA reductase-like NAD-dependent aldehyde dehydrogenase
VRQAVADGAQLRAGGAPAGGGDGWYMEPTILTGVRREMAIARQEVFAPVLAVLEARDLDDAIAIVNDTDYGLSASIFTRRLETAFAFSRRADAGAVQVNLPTAGLEYQAPVGGRRASGSGHREQGKAALAFYTDLKTIAMRYEETG